MVKSTMLVKLTATSEWNASAWNLARFASWVGVLHAGVQEDAVGIGGGVGEADLRVSHVDGDR